MKFIQMSSLLQTNSLFKKLAEMEPGKEVEISAYSCKSTKFDKKNIKLPKPLRFFISILEMEFINSDFSAITMKDFKTVSLNTVLSDISYMIFLLSKNSTDTCEYIEYFKNLLEWCVKTKNSVIYKYGIQNSTIYLVYDKMQRKVILIKMKQDGGINVE